MRKIAGFIVDHRILTLVIVLATTAVSGFFALQVDVNSDMTKYLPDDSSMKMGIDRMEEEFPDEEATNTIRVMFADLPQEQKEQMQDALSEIQYVKEITYEPDDEDYNKDHYTLYVLGTAYDFDTPEVAAIEATLDAEFSVYSMVYVEDSDSETGLTPLIIFGAVAILMVILFVMSASWLEPLLFLAAIGIAIVINMGTNFILGSISNVTSSICALLQLALSMDYSIILINRYRQELEQGDGKYEAMKRAMVNASASIASSSVTTVVGLLVLVFMSFKIGKDLGIVLAKGVFISMLSVFTILPVLILMCDKGILKTAKKVPHFKMGGLSSFSYRFRHVIAIVFVALFIDSYLMQGNTTIAYTLDEPDPIADVFPTTNTILVLFDNNDDQIMADIGEHLKGNEYVKSVASVSTTIGKPYTSAELAAELEDVDTDTDMDLDASMLDILYYYHYKNGETGTITTSDFLRFIVEDVADNETFEEYLDDDIRDNLDLMAEFADKNALLEPKSSAEFADLFDMEEGDIQNLFVYYFGEYGGVEAGTMTLPQFVGFIKSDVLPDEDFSSMIDEETLDMIDTLVTLTNRGEIITRKTAEEIADTLEMDADDLDMLLMLYYARQGAADSLELTFPQFANLLLDEILKDERFEDSFDEEARSDIDKLAVFASPERFRKEEHSGEIADALGMDPDQANLLYMLYFAGQGAVNELSLKAADVVAMLMDEILEDEQFADAFDEDTREQMDILGAFGTKKKFMAEYSSKRFADLLDIKQEMADLLYSFYHAGSTDVGELTVPEFVRFLGQDISRKFSSMFPSEQREQIAMLATFTDSKTLLASYNSTQMARLLGGMGIDKDTVDGIFYYLGATEMTLSDFIDTLVGFTGSQEMLFLQNLKEAALSGTAYSFVDMSAVIGMDAGMIKPLYLYHMTLYGKYKLPNAVLYDLVEFITGSMAGSGIGGDDIAQLGTMKELMDAVLAEESFLAEELAGLLSMDEEMAKVLYAYHVVHHGSASRSGWKVSLETLLEYVLEDVATGQFADSLKEEDLKDLDMARTLMQSTQSGRRFTASGLADLVDMEPEMLRVLYAYYMNQYGDTSDWTLSLQELVGYILDDLAFDEDFGDLLEEETLEDLRMLRKIMDGTLAGTAYRPTELAELLDIDRDMPAQLYLLNISRYGDSSGWNLSLHTFIHFIHDDVLTDEDLADQINADDVDMLDGARRIVDSVMEGAPRNSAQMTALLDGLSDELSADSVKLLYVYYFSRIDSDPQWTFSINDLFNYLLDDVMDDPLFADVFDDEMRETLYDSKEDLDDAIAQLAGPNYSRMIISTTFPGESEDTYAFIRSLIEQFEGNLGGNYYLIGSSPMNFEMAQSFDREMAVITLLTAIAIFIVIAVTFRSLLIPAILVLIIQCGVYLTISIIGLMGYSIFYLALLIVQCILMGATIDYGILFTSYYRESRQTLGVREALTAAYSGSIHTILTSGLIMIVVTGILGLLFENPTIGQICQTISRGAICATALITFVLPGILTVFDRWICKNAKKDHA